MNLGRLRLLGVKAMIRFALTLFAALSLGADYYAAHDRAVGEKRPLVVGVGCAAPHGAWITASAARLDGFKGPCIVVSTPGGADWMEWRATLPPSATAKDVQAILGADRTLPGPKAFPPAAAPIKSPKKWNPYQQPDFQERMRRERSGAGAAQAEARWNAPLNLFTAPTRQRNC